MHNITQQCFLFKQGRNCIRVTGGKDADGAGPDSRITCSSRLASDSTLHTLFSSQPMDTCEKTQHRHVKKNKKRKGKMMNDGPISSHLARRVGCLILITMRAGGVEVDVVSGAPHLPPLAPEQTGV